MNAVFRADASHIIGHGHVMRCLTLARALRECDVGVSFVCREHKGHLCELIEEEGFTVRRLPVPTATSKVGKAPLHAAWLGVTWQEDARQTSKGIESGGHKPDWLVVDHYALDSRWESALRTSSVRIMVIDDLADRVHDCDLLLDQNLVAQMHSRYVNKVPAVCHMLLGPEYALLQPTYAELHDRLAPREGSIKRIFIYFGGADRDNLTGRSLSAFLSLNRMDIEVDVVIASSGPHAESIHRRVMGYGNIHLHSGLPTLASLMGKADLAIGAGGATSWERLCLGLPALVVTLADNQRPIAEELQKMGLIRWIGHKDKVTERMIKAALAESLTATFSHAWMNSLQKVVDGRGANRICGYLNGAEFSLPRFA